MKNRFRYFYDVEFEEDAGVLMIRSVPQNVNRPYKTYSLAIYDHLYASGEISMSVHRHRPVVTESGLLLNFVV